ncbi:MAG: hypothetical protein V3U92_05275 [Cellulophaga sp.]
MKIVILLFFTVFSCGKKTDSTENVEVKIERNATQQSIVFIAGFDEGKNTYYTNAESYFRTKNITVVNNQFSLEEILLWLNQHQYKNYKEIHIVSHSNPWRGMSLKATENGERITLESLLKAKKNKNLPMLKAGIINNTNLIFHSCGLGENQALVRQLKSVFTAIKTPKVYVSSFFNIFGGNIATHYLAKPYYGYYPTAESPGPLQISKELKQQYPKVAIDWFRALKKRKPIKEGDVYTYKFNIPISWEFTFEEGTVLPKFTNKEALMDWVSSNEMAAEALYKLGIPMEKYRWKSQVKGNTLYIKGKTTVVCVMQPLMELNDDTTYRFPQLKDKELYHLF